jgi:hypothetical protein
MDFKKLLMIPLAAVFMFAAVPGFAADVSELERRLGLVSDELDKLKGSGGGSGGGHKTSVHGYGETHWSAPEGGAVSVDQHRFVIGVHSEISDWIHLNAEIDFEHAASKLEFEFAHIDLLINQAINVRAGTMLMPMGNLNEFHEPNRFYTLERPDFHKVIIPSTWQQAGFGIFGGSGNTTYRLYLTNAIQSLEGGADGNKLDDGTEQTGRQLKDKDFIRSGRSMIGIGGKSIRVGDLALTGRIEQKTSLGQAGFSFYVGDSTAGLIEQDGRVTLIVFDFQGKTGAFDYDIGYAHGWVDDTKEINAADGAAIGEDNFAIDTDGDASAEAEGFLLTLAVHVPELMGKKTVHDIIPYIQYQRVAPNHEAGEGLTRTAANEKLNYDVLGLGVAYKPHPFVAFKAGYRINYHDGVELATAQPGDAGTSKSYFEFGVGYQY